ncbi:pseudouridine synthase [Comamonas testosteroni]|uniref:Pseudouridine synthase n=1 Tax=Comamonas testosteroni TaxID=285 RepID=A0A8B4RXN8_COMTE|nr:pseudouridine synthase [Comamonas testosteroni]EHN66394.1 Pseudouridine synthase, Rsu [Comamonas testosteroni ATCC 11996]QQN70826.1 pseudouridine synthase [Comamonas testosteroni]SUY73690.1 Ribosomal large subunit pseudouridine synthase E [Comamonas testosteroni]
MSVSAFVAKLAAMPRPFSSNRSSNLRRSTVVRQPASRPEVTRLLCFHKPYGVLSQFTPEGKWQGLKDWIDVPGVYVAGRLDADSEGLLLLTNDGQLQARIADPRHKMEKTYWVQVEGMPDETALQRLRDGVELSDGKTLPAKARLIDPQPGMWPRNPPIRVRQNIPDCWIELVIREGRNRQVRRMTAAVGYPTLRLVRMAVGPYSIEGLEPGQWLDVLPLSGS